ncbi:hypothetical protein CGCSCA1_v000873 [Colletotrichum siamense]|nr:hypothetical protein CGCSCA1_v000873 [Colletotrichum siamense]
MNGFTATAILAFTGTMANLVAGAPAIEANGTRRKLTTTSIPTVTDNTSTSTYSYSWPTENWPTENWPTENWPTGLPIPVLTTIRPEEPTFTPTQVQSYSTVLHTRKKLPQTTSTADVDVDIEYVTVTHVVEVPVTTVGV